MAPVILKMDLHCSRCVRRIRKLIKDHYGVEDLWLSLETGYVVVAAGPWPDASRLKWRIQRATGKPVDIVSDGSEEEAPPDNGQMLHVGPPQPYGYPSYNYGYGYGYGGGGGVWVPPALQYYNARHQYVPNEAPVCFNDDNPNGCCTMQ